MTRRIVLLIAGAALLGFAIWTVVGHDANVDRAAYAP